MFHFTILPPKWYTKKDHSSMSHKGKKINSKWLEWKEKKLTSQNQNYIHTENKSVKLINTLSHPLWYYLSYILSEKQIKKENFPCDGTIRL